MLPESRGFIEPVQPPRVRSLHRRAFLLGSAGIVASWVAWNCGRVLFEGRREGEEDGGEPFEHIADGTPLIGKRVVLKVTLQEASNAHVEVQLTSRDNGELMIAIDGERYELPEKQPCSDEPLTKLVKNVTKRGREIHLDCGFGTAHIGEEELANAAYLFRRRAADSQPQRITASFSLSILPKARATASYPVSLRKSDRP